MLKGLVNYAKGLILLGLCWICWVSGAIALPVPAQQPVQEIQVHLGTPQGELKFVPDRLEFTAGKRYKLRLDNPSNQKHYFTAKDFADTIWTQKVEAGKVEVKGAIHELELKPGAIAEWVLIPQKTGEFELHCSVPGHAAAGMVGMIKVIADGPAI
ncbi:MAG: cupredoxin domain-containing protein [Synechococcus sp.]|nr:cupredoxin domain-containing protein [Synechococcus sp.]